MGSFPAYSSTHSLKIAEPQMSIPTELIGNTPRPPLLALRAAQRGDGEQTAPCAARSGGGCA